MTYLQLLPIEILDTLKPYLAKENGKDYKNLILSVTKSQTSPYTYIVRGGYLTIIGILSALPIETIVGYSKNEISTVRLVGLLTFSLAYVLTFTFIGEKMIIELDKDRNWRFTRLLES